jgi:hypothetical protein
MSNFIAINGVNVDIGTEVVHYPMPVRPFRFGITIRKGQPDLGVIHWTAGENPAPSTIAWLQAVGLSVHFIIDREGVIHQVADPGIWKCMHAGPRANHRSVGIEVTSYGHAGKKAPLDPDRPTYEGTVHGWTTEMADFYPCQYDALADLCAVLNVSLKIPLQYPAGPAERLSNQDLKDFSGWCGHYHVTPLEREHPKIDPGPRVLSTLFGGIKEILFTEDDVIEISHWKDPE